VWGRRQKRDKWGQHNVTARDQSTWTRGQDEALRIVPEELWRAAHARLTTARNVYLRGSGGRLWGRPANGIESRWLLTGFGRCERCGGGMEVRTLDYRYARKGHFYQCASYVRRGPTVCSNRLELPVERAHAAVIDAIEASVLHPDVVSAAIREALDELRRPQALDAGQGAALKEELRTLAGQVANLTSAVKLGGPLPALVAELQTVERRRAEITRTLKPGKGAPADEAKLQTLIGEWRGMFRNNDAIARQIIAQLLDGEPVVFTPQDNGAGWDFVAPCTLEKVSIGAGTGTPRSLVTPAGPARCSAVKLRGIVRALRRSPPSSDYDGGNHESRGVDTRRLKLSVNTTLP
jgi:hypothetical protein